MTLWSSLSIQNSIHSCITRKPDESCPSNKEMSWHLTNHKQWSQVQLMNYPTWAIHTNVVYQRHGPFGIARYNTDFHTARPGNFGTHLYAGNIKVAKRVLPHTILLENYRIFILRCSVSLGNRWTRPDYIAVTQRWPHRITEFRIVTSRCPKKHKMGCILYMVGLRIHHSLPVLIIKTSAHAWVTHFE